MSGNYDHLVCTLSSYCDSNFVPTEEDTDGFSTDDVWTEYNDDDYSD